MAKRLPSQPPVIPGFSYIRPLGAGGFSDVFLYEQDFPRREVAVKVMLDKTGESDMLTMFANEADALALVTAHPAILDIYQASRAADGRPYLVMQYCPDSYATSYREYVLSVGEVLDVGVRMAGALETVHRAGIVHRDVKPSNILRTATSAPVLSDFGVASKRHFNIDEERVAMSVPWAAPEVVSESTSGSVAADVWSLGATIYSLLAGHSPFERAGEGANTLEKMQRRIQQAKYVPIGRDDVLPELETVLARALSHRPASRQSSAAVFGQQLQDVQRELNLPVTELEILGDKSVSARVQRMAQGSTSTARLPRQTTVAHQGRAKQQSDGAGRPTRVSLDGIPNTQPARRISPPVAITLAAVGVLALVGAVLIVTLGG